VTFLKQLLLLLLIISQLSGAWSWFQKDSVQVHQNLEEVYLSFRYNGVIDDIILAYYDGERFYLPITELFDLFGIFYEFDPRSFSISGNYISADEVYVMDFHRRFATVNERAWTLSANDFVVKEVDFYVAPALLKEIFGLDLKVNLSALNIKLESSRELPVISRYRKRLEHSRGRGRSRTFTDTTYAVLGGRQPELSDGLFLDYTLRNSISQTAKMLDLKLKVGGELGFGDVQGDLGIALGGNRQNISSNNIRWRYSDESNPWFTSVVVGQQSVRGVGGGLIQGIRLTNEPLFRSNSFDVYVVDGLTEPEAEVELYQDGRLVDVITSDEVGYYRFLTPLNYGASEYKVRIYGRQGRVIEHDRQIRIPFNFIPVNEVRYNVSAGRTASSYLPWSKQDNTANANVSIGLKNWLTTGLGVIYSEGANKDRPSFYSITSARVLNSYLVNLDIAENSYTKLTFSGTSPQTSSLSATYTQFPGSTVTGPLSPRHSFSTGMFLPVKLSGIQFTGRMAVDWSKLSVGNQFNFSTTVNHSIRALRFKWGWRERHYFGDGEHIVSSKITAALTYIIPRVNRYHPIIRGSYFRLDGGYTTSSGNFDNLSFQYVKQFSRQIKVQSFLRYNPGQNSISLDLGLIWDFDKVKSTINMRARPNSSSFAQTYRGSVGFDRNFQEIIFDNRSQVGKSALVMRMFVDENSNGVYEFGEEIIPENAIMLEGGSSRILSKNGVSRLTQLQPYRKYNCYINQGKIRNPMLVPTYKDFTVVTDPNQYKLVDVPFYTSGIIEGAVEKRVPGQDVRPVAGLRIHIRSVDGTFQKTMRTYADGSYYSMEIPPGEYEAWVDDRQLEFLGMNSIPAIRNFHVQSTSEGDYIEALDFTLE